MFYCPFCGGRISPKGEEKNIDCKYCNATYKVDTQYILGRLHKTIIRGIFHTK